MICVLSLSLAIGFPIPYFGILTVEGMEGSLFKVISPLIHQKYHMNITEDFKLPSPAPKPNANYYINFMQMNGNIVPYFDKETFVFLYVDSEKKAVRYDITNRIHKKIMGSLSPNSHFGRILHVRLGKGSLLLEYKMNFVMSSNMDVTKSLFPNLLRTG